MNGTKHDELICTAIPDTVRQAMTAGRARELARPTSAPGEIRRDQGSSSGQALGHFLAGSAEVLSRYCLFLDVDGTLIEFNDDPIAVNRSTELVTLLQCVSNVLGGAVALVSGRSLDYLDLMFSPLRLAAAGIHGIERRDARAVIHRKAVNARALDPVRLLLSKFTAANPGVLLEDKSSTVALHFRRVPALVSECRQLVYGAVAELVPHYQVQEGSMVLEIKPAGISKATAIEEFLLEPPFTGRIPIAVGDDLSDCEAFAAVHRHGGLSVAVGRRIGGDWNIANSDEARRWLSALIQEGAG
jgi:trehalose 6-phosphate phosphatase